MDQHHRVHHPRYRRPLPGRCARGARPFPGAYARGLLRRCKMTLVKLRGRDQLQRPTTFRDMTGWRQRPNAPPPDPDLASPAESTPPRETHQDGAERGVWRAPEEPRPPEAIFEPVRHPLTGEPPQHRHPLTAN